VRPAALSYVRAETMQDLDALLQRDGTTLMAGGQGLMRDLRNRSLHVGTLVDVSRLAELAYVTEDDGVLEVGAVTTLAAVAADPQVAARCPALAQAASRVADVQVRNRGTVGGNVCGSWLPTNYSNDIGVALAASGGELVVRSGDRQQLMSAATFFASEDNPLARGEFIRALRFPLAAGSAYLRLSHQWADAGMGSAAAFVDRRDGAMRLGLAVGRIGRRPLVLDEVARAIEADGLDAPSVSEAIAATLDSTPVIGNVHADEAYRRRMVPVLVRRAVEQALISGGLK